MFLVPCNAVPTATSGVAYFLTMIIYFVSLILFVLLIVLIARTITNWSRNRRERRLHQRHFSYHPGDHSIICPYCKYANRPRAKFCSECGNVLNQQEMREDM